jgi:serine/threonine protein phosphatase PrpC
MSGLRFRSWSMTHPGVVRTLNEDALIDDPVSGIWAVADGVGGHAAGDYASQLVVAALGRIGPQASAATLLASVRADLDAANANLRAFAANEGADLVATTVAVLLCFGQHYAALWAGDSRIYLLRDRRLHSVTRDHTVVQDLLDDGAITEAEAEHHPRRNVITRAIGADDTLELEMVQDRIQPDDLFLLCSDGLTKVVTDAEIASLIAAGDRASIPQRLIDEVLERGAPDNVTIVAVECAVAE